MIINVDRKDTIWSFFGILFSMGTNLLLLPFILFYLPDDATALYYVFLSLSAVVTLFDFGFTPSIARSIAYAWSGATRIVKKSVEKAENCNPNFLLIAQLVRTCKITYSFIASIAFLMASTIGTFYISFLVRNNPLNCYYIAWLIYAFAIFLNILFNYYSVFLRGVGAIAKVNIALVVSRIVQIIICIILLVHGAGLLGVSIAYLVNGLLFRTMAGIFFYKYKDIGKKLKQYNEGIIRHDIWVLVKTMWPNTWRDGIITVSNYFLNQVTIVVASIFLTLYQTGIYSLSIQLVSAIAMIAGTLNTTYQPALQSAYARRDINLQRKYISMIVISFIFLFILGILLLIFIGLPILEYLKPSYRISVSLLLSVGFYQFLLKFINCYSTYISTTNRLMYTKSFVISAFTSLILSIVFSGVFKMQLYGLVMAQVISQLIFNAWYWPAFVHKELNLGILDMIKIVCRLR